MAKLKLLKYSSFYPAFLANLYEKESLLKNKPYSAQYAHMMSMEMSWADYWKKNLEKTGRFEVEEVIINNEYSQKKWAVENGIVYDADNWMEDIMYAQAQYFQPHLVFANDYALITAAFRKKIKLEIPPLKGIICWDGVGLMDPGRFEECDLLLSCNPGVVSYYQSHGIPSVYFPFGFESSILDKIDTHSKKYDVSFIGSLTLRPGGHHQRLKLLAEVARNCKTDYWLSSFTESKPYLIKNILKMLRIGKYGDVRDIFEMWFNNKGTLFGLEMYQTLASSHITLNNHIDTSNTLAGNIRLWEATGVGTCLITDWKENLISLFEPDKEIVTYHSAEECIEKIQYLINHPDVMNTIAAAGQKRTLEYYSYKQRFEAFIPILENLVA